MAEATYSQVLSCSAEQLKKAITDYEGYPKHLEGLKYARIVEDKGAEKRVEFELEIIKVFRYTLLLKESGWNVSWQLADGDLFKKNTGQWTLKPMGADKVEANYVIDIELKMFVPSMLSKKIAGANLPSTFRQFEQWARTL
jgi:ribosome-associated toxin RatA of RatAB toxin-antitoxin module